MDARVFALWLALPVVALVAGQAPPSFEVASVKPQSSVRAGSVRTGNRYYEPSVTLRRVAEFGYDLPSFRIVGGPSWIDSERWTIDARTASPVGAVEMRALVRRLMVDRFRFVGHFETRVLQTYQLRLAHQDGRFGPKVKETTTACAANVGAKVNPEQKICGPSNILIGAGYVRQRFVGVSFAALAKRLETILSRSVIDKTGVTGPFDFELLYADDTGVPLGSLTAFARQPDARALFTALREELGLRLEPASGPVELLVVDSVERSTPD